MKSAAIAGIGQTTFAKDMGRTELDLALEATRAACADAGFPVAAIQGFVSYHVEQVAEVDLVTALGIDDVRFMARTPSGGGGAASLLGLAALAIEHGTAESVVVFRARNRSKAASYGRDPNQGGRPWAKAGPRLRDFRQWHHPFGVAAPAHEFALIARRHMHVYGTRAEHFGMQAVAQRFHASRNPAAIMRDAITLDDWASSRPIADPIRLFDCSLENDGAVAVLVTTIDRARDLKKPAIPVLGHAQYAAPIHTQLNEFFATSAAFGERDDGAVAAGHRLFGVAKVEPADVDVALVVEPFTCAVPFALEQYGFCGRGEGGPFIASGATRWPEGSLPVNTHGGSNGEAFIHGVNHLPEAVRQLRGCGPQSSRGRRGRVRLRRDQRSGRRRVARSRPMSAAFPHPEPASAYEAQFWAALGAGELRLQRCAECGAFRHPPRPVCAHCGAVADVWVASSGAGEVWSYTVIYPPTLPAFADRTPYGAVVVRLDEGVFFVSNLVDCSVDELAVGVRVELALTRIDDELVLPLFRRSG